MSKPENKTNKTILGQKLVTANSVMELATLTATESGGRDVWINNVAAEHIAVQFDKMWDDLLDNHLGDIRRVIKKRAALYYSQLSPTTLNDITDALKDVVINSAIIFGCICSAWKYQNANQFEDEDGLSLQPVLGNITNASLAMTTQDAASNTSLFAFNYGISNSDWKKKILKKLKGIYISDMFAEFAFTFMGHFIQLDPNADSVMRLITFDPYDITDTNTQVNLNAFAGALDLLEAKVDDAYNKYPFMDELMNDFKLYVPDEKYNFTRDLAQCRLKINADVNDLVSSMIYSTAMPIINEALGESATVLTRLVRPYIQGSSKFKFYKDDYESAETIVYNDRIQVLIHSNTNALRNNCHPLNIAVHTVSFNGITGVRSNLFYTINPYPIYVPSSVSSDQHVLRDVADNNSFRDALDMPTDACKLYVTLINPDGHRVLDAIKGYDVLPNLSSGDFIISPDDIESVISDATYTFLFGEVKELESVVQTLGNDGVNN